MFTTYLVVLYNSHLYEINFIIFLDLV